jgi:hypothetical protein
VLFALVDADYRFIWVDIGAEGRCSDSQIYNNSELKETIENQTIRFPDADALPGDTEAVPYFIIGDDAFALKTNLMKPFRRMSMDHDERIFNYRLSRARRCVEQAFGIMAHRFGCLGRSMQQDPETCICIVGSVVCLHNLMRMRYPTLQNLALDDEDEDHNIIPGEWRAAANVHDMEEYLAGNRGTLQSKVQRNYLKNYYVSAVGSVPWQEKMITLVRIIEPQVQPQVADD